MLKVSAFYLEKQKSFIPKKYFFGRSQYQNKKALFTDSIFPKVLGAMKWKQKIFIYFQFSLSLVTHDKSSNRFFQPRSDELSNHIYNLQK